MYPTATSDLSPAALTALMAGWKQTDRLLRLHTPLGPDVLLAETLKGIECLSGQEASITGFKLQLDCLSLDAHLALKTLIGQSVLLELMTDQSRSVLRAFHGHVTAVSCVGANGANGGNGGIGGMARYRLTIEPWLRFLGVGRDSAVFQDMSVLDIVQAIFSDYQSSYQGNGKLVPAWRLDILDASVYPQRSLTTQYQESDLAFIERLLAEEGLFYWFEHSGDPHSASRGAHTLVIADHNAAFQPNARSSVRFSQSRSTIEDDTIDRWCPQAQWHTHAVEIASWDYRTLSTRPVSEHAPAVANTPALISQDTPGAYAYENAAQGQRLALNHLQALSVSGHTVSAAGSVRAFCPGSTFTLSEHASHDGSNSQRDSFIVLRVIHHAHNNLSAELKTQASFLPKSAASPLDTCLNRYELNSQRSPNGQQDLFYRNALAVLPLAEPYRAALADGCGQLIHPKPTAPGSQTALVIGVPGQALSTERDHRIKVQFAWQRGTNSQSRLAHPAPEGHSGAPAADAPGATSGASGTSGTSGTTGTWVRVATALAPIAGANWGAVALPRIGQEVLVTFLDGDIDRPVVMGALYNGRGQDNAQSNQVAAGAANATGNAPMWFPGDQAAQGAGGALPGHAHNAVLSGIKTQALSASQSGAGGYNQLVFDDTPGQSRLGLHTHSAPESHSGASELNLGALRQQSDNQRLAPTGFGLELKTQHSGAVRAGAGLLLSADARRGNDSGAASAQLDSKEAQEQLQSAHELLSSLSQTAQAHKAMLPVLQGSEAKPKDLPAIAQLQHNLEVIQAQASDQGGNTSTSTSTAYSEPVLVLSAPAGIALLTPQSASLNAGQTSSLSAAQDINLLAQGHAGQSVKGGISLFTYGKASAPHKPNTETGIRLHAASGKVSSQSQSSKTQITADKAVTIASTTEAVSIQAKEHVLLTAQGAYIKMAGGNIEVHAPGMVKLLGSMKSFVSGMSSSIVPPNFPSAKLAPNQLVIERLYHDREALAGAPFVATFLDGSTRKGVLDGAGRAALDAVPAGAAQVRFGAMPGSYERKDASPMPGYKPAPGKSDMDTLMDKYAAPATGAGA
ncbi:MAG: type VI secretion system tip protein VgrG [Polaromonas sp.]|uniref:type VI secretion system Vgr family protein n=1 Tax=Polaromonas sp. TaxID=1869339 RepID=UPI001800A9B4|nr:type VI secretion system Vgr family protein [Polaromonas sp.]NMM10513.1 type VI secretion system tip protein VgrG [Polaromonas sp.]